MSNMMKQFDFLPGVSTIPLQYPFVSNSSWSNSTIAAPKEAHAEGLLARTSWTSIVGVALVVLLLVNVIENLWTSKKRPGWTKIPGPWYASLTTLHLKWLFARGTIWKYVEREQAKHGDIVRLGPRQVWISDKETMKKILATIDLPKVSVYAEISRDRFSPGLFGEIRPKPHAVLKRFLGPAFTVTSVDKLDTFFMESTSILLNAYYGLVEKSNKPDKAIVTDFMRDLHCLALDIMGQSSFGKGFGQIDKIFDPTKVKTKRDKEWAKIPSAIFDGLANRYRFVFIKRALRKLGWNIEFDWPKSMTKAIGELIDERADRSLDEQKQDQRIDVLQHMLDNGTRPDTGERMKNQEIIDQMSELLLAGSETTSGTIGCLFLELARNPHVRAKLLKSLPVLTPSDPIIDSKRVREEPTYRYLEAVIKEVLRLHPIASEMGRRTLEQGFTAGEYEIPPYTVVSASYRLLHKDERYWPSAERFWPERWLQGDEREGAPEPDMDAYYPYSAGKHSCIGQNFAYAEIRTVSANVLSRFDITEEKEKHIDFRQFITMQFSDGSWEATLHPRWLSDDTASGQS